MFVTLHVTGLLLLSITENRSSTFQHVINNSRRRIIQYETSSLYDVQSSNKISSNQYIDHFESLIYHQLSNGNTKIQHQSKPKDLVFKMDVLSSSSCQCMQSYIQIFASNIPNPFDSVRRSRSFLSKCIKSQMLYISAYTSAISTNRKTLKCHDSPLEDDGLTVVMRSTHNELRSFLANPFQFKVRVYTIIIRV